MNKSFLFKLVFLLSFCFYQPVYAESVESVNNDVASSEMPLILNLNTATADQLSSVLFGIGSSKANAIIAYREQNGDFGSVEDLLMVKGVGIKILEENRPLLTIE